MYFSLDLYQLLPPLLPIEKSSSIYNASSPEPSSQFSDNSITPPPPKSTMAAGKFKIKGRRGRSKGNGPAQLPCSICGDLAPDHMHYGGVACFSCRYYLISLLDNAPKCRK